MRRTFADILNSSGFDVVTEYQALFTMFYADYFRDAFGSVCPYKEIANAFPDMDIRGTAVSIQDFNRRHGFHFQELISDDVDMDALVGLCEYITNMVASYRCIPGGDFLHSSFWTFKLDEQVERVIESIGYERIRDRGLVCYVEKSPAARRVAEALPDPVSYRVIEYNHHSMKGDLAGKRALLNELAKLLEPRRGELERLDRALEGKLFSAFNNCDVRHNNREPGAKSFHESVAELGDRDLEDVYDAVYTLCLVAFLKLDDADKLASLDKVLERI